MPSDLEIALDDLKAGVHGVIAKVEAAISGQSPDMHEVHQGLYELRAVVEKEVATVKERLASLWPTSHVAMPVVESMPASVPIAQPVPEHEEEHQ